MARGRLRQALHLARRTLQPLLDVEAPEAGSRSAYLNGHGPLVVLAEGQPIWTDVAAFEAALAHAREVPDPAAYQRAVDLYGGDLLPEDRYEDWAAPRREELRAAYLSALADLARLHEARGEVAAAINTLQRLVAAEPIHEAAHTALMRLHAAQGERLLALRQFRQLSEALARELDAQPGAASRQLYESLATARDTAMRPSPPGVPAPARHNLPAALTRFVGRDQAIEAVRARLGTARLVTLVGVGGVGKTRLAIEVATRVLVEYPHGVWLVELASAGDAGAVVPAVASAIGLNEEPAQPLLTTLQRVLRHRRTLLILDNCEHLLDACAHVAEALLRACPDLRIMATSREPLGMLGEATWPVPALALPDRHQITSLDRLGLVEAVELFVDRARFADDTFAVTGDNAAAVAHICRVLDGIPLAIELAAVWVRDLPVEEIATRLDRRFELLARGNRTALPRHQTLEAALDWSYQRLSALERRLFNRLGVFAGSFTPPAAEAICAGDGATGAGRLLERLERKSLVVMRPSGGELRYVLLDTLRQYALVKLEAAGEAVRMRRRHAAWHAEYAEQAAPHLTGPEQETWFSRLEIEHENLRQALASSAADPEGATVQLRLAAALGRFWRYHSHIREGREWLSQALARRAEAPLPVTAQALNWAGLLEWLVGNRQAARELLEECVRLASGIDDQTTLASAYRHLGLTYLGPAGPSETGHHFAAALAAARRARNKREIAFNLAALGAYLHRRGAGPERAKGRRMVEESLVRCRRLGDKSAIEQALRRLTHVLIADGESERARALLEERLQVIRAIGSTEHLSNALGDFGRLLLREGKVAGARALYQDALAHDRSAGIGWDIVIWLERFAQLNRLEGNADVAARLFAAAARRRSPATASAGALSDYQPDVVAVRDALGEAAFTRAWHEGEALSDGEALAMLLPPASPDSPGAAPPPPPASDAGPGVPG